MVAFRGAIEMGADGIELDVHRSKDGEIVVHHGVYLDRTAFGKGSIYDWNSQDLIGLDAGSWFDLRFKNERIPMLDQVLAEFGSKVKWMIEMKGIYTDDDLSSLLAVTDQYPKTDIQFTSYNHPLLRALKDVRPAANTGIIYKPFDEWMNMDLQNKVAISQAKLNKTSTIHISDKYVNPALVEQSHQAGMQVLVAIVDTMTEFKRMENMGVDQIITNDLSALVSSKQPQT